MYYGQRQLTDNERYLQDEVDRLKRNEEERLDRERDARDEHRREMNRAIEAENRSADTWPEALRKQVYLFEREANSAGEYDTDNYFADGAKACKRGLEIWREVATIEQAKINELRRQIEAIEEGVALEVSKRLMAEAEGRGGWQSIARSIENDDPGDFLNW